MRPHRRSHRPKRRLDRKFLRKSIVIALAAILTLVVAERIQSPRVFALLRRRADKAAEEKKWSDAASYLSLYVRMNPADDKAQGDLGIYLSRVGTVAADFDAKSTLQQSLRRNESRPDVRLALLELSLNIGDIQRALDEAKALESSSDLDSNGWQKVGQAYRLCGMFPEANRAYEKSIAADPQNLVAQQSYLDLLARLDPKAILLAIDKMQRSNPNSPMASLVSYVVRRDHNLADADKSLDEALAKFPNDPEVLLLAIGRELIRDPNKAGPLLDRAQKAKTNDPRILLVYGKWLASRGKESEALERWKAGYERNDSTKSEFAWRIAELLVERRENDALPIYFSVLLQDQLYRPVYFFLRGRMQILDGKEEQAKSDLLQARELLTESSLRYAPAEFRNEVLYKVDLGLARVAMSEGAVADAIEATQRASKWLPTQFLPHSELGRIYYLIRDYVKSADSYSTALQYRQYPAVLRFEYVRALLHGELQRPKSERNYNAFLSALQKAKRADPDASSLVQLEAEYQMNELDLPTAVVTLKAGFQGHPNDVAVGISLLQATVLAGRHKEALAIGQRIERQFGRSRESAIALATLALQSGDLDQAETILKSTSEKLPADARGVFDQARGQIAWQRKPDSGPESLFKQAAGDNLSMPLFHYFLAQLRGDDSEKFVNVASANRSVDDVLWRWSELYLDIAPIAVRPTLFANQARQHSSSLRESAPYWWGTDEASAIAAELSGQTDVAIRQYYRGITAIDGSAYSFLLEHVVELLLDLNRKQDAADLFHQAKMRRFPMPHDRLIGLTLRLGMGETDEALAAAKGIADANPDDLVTQIWYVKILSRSKNKSGAEDRLRLLFPKYAENANVWITFAEIRQKSDDPEKNALFDEIAKTVKGTRKSYCLGAAALLLGNDSRAESEWGDAANAGGLASNEWRNIVTFLASRRSAHLAKITELAKKAYPDARWLASGFSIAP